MSGSPGAGDADEVGDRCRPTGMRVPQVVGRRIGSASLMYSVAVVGVDEAALMDTGPERHVERQLRRPGVDRDVALGLGAGDGAAAVPPNESPRLMVPSAVDQEVE